MSAAASANAPAPPTINAADFGCVGDGATDNTTCLANLGVYIQTHNVTVTFDPGQYEYTNPNWLTGPVVSGKIIAYGASFQNNISASGLADIQYIALGIGKIDIWTAGPYYGSGTPTAPSNPISTVAAGTNVVTLQNTSNYTNFTSCLAVYSGCHAIIMGYDEMNTGWPPAERYFDYVTVTALNSSTGDITLDSNLKYSYDSRWANELKSVITTGAPTITPIDGTPGGGWIQNLTIEGATFLDNPTHPRSGGTYGEVYVTTADSFECISCTLAHGVPHEANTITFTNSTVYSGGSGGAAFEIDKLTDTFTFQNGQTLDGGAFSQCASTNYLNVLNSTITGDAPCPAKHVTWENNTISVTGPTAPYKMLTGVGDGAAPPMLIYDFIVQDNIFRPTEASQGLVETYNEGNFTISAVSGSGPYTLTMPIVFNSSGFPNAVQTLVPSSVVRVMNGVGGAFRYVAVIGGSILGNGSCTATAASPSGGTSATGTISIVSGAPNGDVTITHPGRGYTSTPTAWTLSAGRGGATCSGNPSMTTTGGRLNFETGTVTAVYMSGGNLQVEVSMNTGTPSTGDVLSFSSVLHLVMTGNTQLGGYHIQNVRNSNGNAYSGPDFNDVIDDDSGASTLQENVRLSRY
jgi:hypothetical protein